MPNMNLDEETKRSERVINLSEKAQKVGSFSEVQREKGRMRLALGLLLLFAATVLAPIPIWLLTGSIPAWLIQYTKDIASMELGLLGAAVAFYYQSVSSGLG